MPPDRLLVPGALGVVSEHGRVDIKGLLRVELEHALESRDLIRPEGGAVDLSAVLLAR